jgi:hypothetical protein
LTALLKRIKKSFRVFLKNTSEIFFVGFQTCLCPLSRDNIKVNPQKINHLITGTLILLSVGIGIYWILQIQQIPSPPTIEMGVKSTALASNQNTSSASALFGEKPLAAHHIFLRGIVITSQNSTGTLDGLAIFEINGKSTNAIAIGERFANDLTLKSIQPESATLLYQGQEMEFTLSKSKSAAPTTTKKH